MGFACWLKNSDNVILTYFEYSVIAIGFSEIDCPDNINFNLY